MAGKEIERVKYPLNEPVDRHATIPSTPHTSRIDRHGHLLISLTGSHCCPDTDTLAVTLSNTSAAKEVLLRRNIISNQSCVNYVMPTWE